MILDTAQVSAIGDRLSNQDALAYACEDEISCFVIADGTGGHEGGEVAARLVIEAVIEKFVLEASFSARALSSYIDAAVVKVAQAKRANAKQKNMSATLATILIDKSNRRALWAHLGDTRIYMFRHGAIKSISKDHSMAQRFVDAGIADYAQIRQHPQRNILFAAIGAEGDNFPDVTQNAVELFDGDAFLLCTDGFWEWISETDMVETLLLATSSDAWLKAMSEIAARNCGLSDKNRDNFSAFTIWLAEPNEVR
jgi:serine/threonine protein phosphatase PrpC